jgi:hypothetical protein
MTGHKSTWPPSTAANQKCRDVMTIRNRERQQEEEEGWLASAGQPRERVQLPGQTKCSGGMHAKPNDAYMTAHTCVNARQRRLNRKGRMSERISWQSCHHARLLGATRPNTTASACCVPRHPSFGHRDARHFIVLHHNPTQPLHTHLQKWCPHEVRMAASLIVSPHSPHARSSFSSVALASRAAASAAISRADIILQGARLRTTSSYCIRTVEMKLMSKISELSS